MTNFGLIVGFDYLSPASLDEVLRIQCFPEVLLYLGADCPLSQAWPEAYSGVSGLLYLIYGIAPLAWGNRGVYNSDRRLLYKVLEAVFQSPSSGKMWACKTLCKSLQEFNE